MPIKILHIVTTYQSLVSILDSKMRLLLSQQGVELHVASAPEEESDKRKPCGVFHPIPMARRIAPLADMISVVKLFALVKMHRFDVIHTHTVKAGLFGAAAGFLAGVPVVHTYHGLPYYRGQRWWEHFLAKYAEAIFSLFRNTLFSQNKNDFERLTRAWYTRCPVVYEGNRVDPAEIERSAMNGLGHTDGLFDSTKAHLLCISRLEPVKALDKVINTVKYLKEAGLAVECIIAGKGNLQHQLERRIRDLGLHDSIQILFSPHVHSLILKSDALILTSKKEGIPRGVLEAMALKKPVVATDVQGTDELVVNGETGIRVPFADQQALNEATLLMLKDKPLRERYGGMGYELILERYASEQETIELWMRTYREILGSREKVGSPKADKQNGKKALFVSTVGYTIEAFLIPYVGLFQKRGYEVISLANWKFHWNKLPHGVGKAHCPFSRKLFSLLNALALFKAFFFLKRERFAVIYTHTPIASVIVRLAKILSRNAAPVIYEIHGLHVHDKGNALTNFIYTFVEESLASHTDKIITINRDDFDFAQRHFAAARSYYAPGIGVDTDYFKPDPKLRQSRRSVYMIGSDDVAIVTVADYITRKRLDLCVGTAKLLVEKGRRFKWFFVGDGRLRGMVRESILAHGLENAIICVGFQDDVRPYLAASDIFVLLSMQEGLPRSLLEAGAMGLPAIVSDIRGNRDIIKDGLNSFLVPTLGHAPAADRIQELMDSPEKRRDLGSRLQADIADSYSLTKALAVHEKIIFDS